MNTWILEELFTELDPDRIIAPTARRLDRAMNTFPGHAVDILSRAELVDYLSAFSCHLDNTVLGLNPPREVIPAIDWSQCHRILREHYGQDATEWTLENARSGLNGGLRGILELLAEGFLKHYTAGRVGALVHRYLDGLTLEQRQAVAHIYAERFDHLLPPELRFCNNVYLVMRLEAVLEQHPHLLRDFRRAQRQPHPGA